MDIATLLREVIRLNASDLHVAAGMSVMVRQNGELVPMAGIPPLDPRTCTKMIYELLNESQRELFEKQWSVDFIIEQDSMRYRANVTLQRHGIEAVFRHIQNQIPTPEELMLPPVVVKMMNMKRGLILVTGPTGSGKSTTLACMLDHINRTRHAKIITIEDPIEYVYTNKNSFISQREVGQHTPDFATALRYILRQDPNVVLVGEMRDYETIAAAIQVAETGHLVLATLHCSDAPQAVDRIIDVFPGHQQQQIRAQLSTILRAVVAQALLPRCDGRGRVAAFEIMINTPAISSMIRQGRTHEIFSAIDMGSADGMKSMNRSLQDLSKLGIIEAGLSPAMEAGPSTSRPGLPPAPDKRRRLI